MGTTFKHTDLSGEEPGPRAIVNNLPQDDITLRGELPLIGGRLTLKARMNPESPLYRLVAAVALVLSGCPCAVILFAIGVPWWAAASAFLLPAAVYFGFPGRRSVK